MLQGGSGKLMRSTTTDKSIYYFDYNSTHPPFRDIIQKNTEYYYGNYFNPSGANRFSVQSQKRINDARSYFADTTGKAPGSIFFASTGTEANHTLLYILKNSPDLPDSVITSAMEHPSVYEALERQNISYRVAGTDKTGIIDLDALADLLSESPSALFIIGAGNETGVIQPLEAIADTAAKFSVPFYSDLMQLFGKADIDYALLDGFTCSGHKIGAGPGASMVCMNPIPAKGLFGGGHQENGLRAGTENIIAIPAFAEVAGLQASGLEEKNKRLAKYQKKIEDFLESRGAEIIARNSPRLPSTTYALLPTDEIDFFIMGMEEAGIYISTGSSCKSRSRDASRTLLSMGYSREEALRAVRISTGYFTGDEDVDYLVEKTGLVLDRLS